MALFMLAMSVSFFSCSDKEEITGATYSRTFVTGYLVPQSVVAGRVGSGVKFTFKGDVITSGVAFDGLSERYNDLSYDRYTVCGPRIAVNDSLRQVNVETVEYFDALHPAGSDVSDLVECRYISYHDYVQSGYKKEEKDAGQYPDLMEYYEIEGAKLLASGLSGINYANSKLVAPDFVLQFNKMPEEKGRYPFRFVFQLAEKQYEVFLEYEFL